ncbi:hypothetical protein BGC_09620 [Burkholderia sp. 3C]
MPDKQRDPGLRDAIGQRRANGIAKLDGNQQMNRVDVAIVEPGIHAEKAGRTFFRHHAHRQPGHTFGNPFAYQAFDYIEFQPGSMMKLDLQCHSRRKRSEWQRNAVDQAFEKPFTYATMTNMFIDLVTRLKMHGRNVEPSRVDVSNDGCRAGS